MNTIKKLSLILFSLSLVISFVFFNTLTTKADDSSFVKVSPSEAAGYYYNNAIGILLMGNGTLYYVDVDTLEMTKNESTVSVYEKNGCFIIQNITGDSFYLELQKDKSKTENDESYYALHKYIGTSAEVTYKEGTNIQIENSIFEVAYDVVLRLSVTKFLGIDPQEALEGAPIEGDGFDTPEEAVQSYLNSLKSMNLQDLISTFAIESYCNNIDAAFYYNRASNINSASIESGIYTTDNILLKKIRTEERSSIITTEILRQMISIAENIHKDDPYISAYSKNQMVVLANNSDIPVDQLLYYLQDIPDLETLEIKEIIPASYINSIYTTENNLKALYTHSMVLNCEGITNLCALIDINGIEMLPTFQLVKYDGRWYIETLVSNISLIEGLSENNSGLILDSAELSLSAITEAITTNKEANTQESRISFKNDYNSSRAESLDNFSSDYGLLNNDEIITVYNTVIKSKLNNPNSLSIRFTFEEYIEFFHLKELTA